MPKSKYTTKEKQLCLLNEYDIRAKNINNACYFNTGASVILDSTGEVLSFNSVGDRCYFFREIRLTKNMLDCGFKINESKKRKRKRVYSKIENLIRSDNAVFLTITFNDSVLSNTSAITRRRYVARFLKENSDIYVANIDFGSCNAYIDDNGLERVATEREHYHALVIGKVNLKGWTYGIINCERVKHLNNCEERISRYIAKISNHAIKTECFETRLIYSRNSL